MVGARLAGAVTGAETVIEKLGSALTLLPSLAKIVMPAEVPTSVAPGVPLSRPVVGVKMAQLGLDWIVNVSASPSGSLAVGWKL